MQFIAPADRYDQHARKSQFGEIELDQLIDSRPELKSRWELLPGGFQNQNFRVESTHGDVVVRIYSDQEAFARESGILKFLREQPVQVPDIRDSFEFNEHRVSILEFVEGESLQSILSDVPQEVFQRVGRELGKVHQIQFDKGGFIGPNMELGEEYEFFGQFVYGYIRHIMETVDEGRLDGGTAEALIAVIQEYWPLVDATDQVKQLCHCDFNPKNILVTSAGEPYLLDWEFSISGNGWIDVGNFFRFAYDYPAEAEESFIRGYESVGGAVPSHWKQIGMLLDLANMASFLERHENYPKTFRTARTVIQHTIESFRFEE